MSNKAFQSLNPIDQKLRFIKPITMSNGTKIVIEMINGFELFNTRPFHNYETWADGYRVSDGKITVEAEDLDEAIDKFKKKVEEL